MRLAELLQSDGLDGFHEADEAGLKTGRKGLDLGIDAIKCFDRPSHGCYIADML